ncbi:MAG: hypothetical protein FWF33_02240, partial [Clostridiales bacterium]|nr:hypothetical protein [Clostridiales bacterium]
QENSPFRIHENSGFQIVEKSLFQFRENSPFRIHEKSACFLHYNGGDNGGIVGGIPGNAGRGGLIVLLSSIILAALAIIFVKIHRKSVR